MMTFEEQFNNQIAKNHGTDVEKYIDWTGLSSGKKSDIETKLNEIQRLLDELSLNNLHYDYDDPVFVQIKQNVWDANESIENARRAVRQNW